MSIQGGRKAQTQASGHLRQREVFEKKVRSEVHKPFYLEYPIYIQIHTYNPFISLDVL